MATYVKTLRGLAAAILVLMGCERPFVPARVPEIEILAPDFSEVHTDSLLMLEVRATSFRRIAGVTLENQPLHYDSLRAVWKGIVKLHWGLNRLRLTAVDEQGVSATDTIWALRLQATLYPGPPLVGGRGAGTLTRLPDGRLLFVGGASTWNGPASRQLYAWTPGNPAFTRFPGLLAEPRAGHTATLLSDGRLILLGGSLQGRPETADDLRPNAEVFDLHVGRGRIFPIAPTAARAWHTTALRHHADRWFLEVLGGYRRLRRDAAELGVASDLITFEVYPDSLRLLTPGIGYYLAPLAGHIMAPLDPDTTRFLVAGSLSRTEHPEIQTFRLRLDPAGPIDLLSAPPLPEPRQFATAVSIKPGVVMILGGFNSQPAQTYTYPLLYVETANRFFRYRTLPLEARFNASATLLENFRILITGGFGPDGQGLSVTEMVELTPF